jgi:GWxTD domain-containing protein
MKKFTLVFSLCLLVSITGLANEKSLRAYLSYATFYAPDQGPFIETYLAVEGNSVVFAPNAEGLYQAAIEVTMIFRQNEEIIDFTKYELKSPKVDDTTIIDFGFIDQQRFALASGSYQLEIQISDLYNAGVSAFVTYEDFTLDFPDETITISGIQLVERFERTETPTILSKSGYDLIPLVYGFYPESSQTLSFYCELYNTTAVLGDTAKFMTNYYIESFEKAAALNDFYFRRRSETKAVNNLLNTINIEQLPSGNYNLVVEVRDRQNELLASNKVFFQRSNPSIQFNLNDITALNVANSFASNYNNHDTLREFIKCLSPISSQMERAFAENLVRDNNLTIMQQYFYNFWLNRDFVSPEAAWREYLNEVQKVNAAFKTQTKKGFESDRGRVYLQYGPPNQLIESYNEPNAYPYEIWHYYSLGNQRNKRFVFYTKDIVTNDFALIHSDAIGELSNFQWQYIINSRMNILPGVDDSRPGEVFGGRADKLFRDPH